MNKQLIISLLIFCACTAQGNRSKDLKQLLRLHEQQKKAHIEKQATLLTEMFAPDFINVDSGNIDRPTKEQSRKRFQSYFDQVEFIAWRDIEDPIIRISKDGTMAYVIVHKLVHLKTLQPDGEVETKITFAWMEAWEKINGNWKMKAIASTDNSEE